MPRDQMSGRYTQENQRELADDQEEDEITGALREEEQRRQTNGTAPWVPRSPMRYDPRTPMPSIDEAAGLVPRTEKGQKTELTL